MEEKNKEKEDQQVGRRRQKITFKDDLKTLMFAFGDVKNPNEETIEILEEYLLYFLNTMVQKCINRKYRREGNSAKLSKEDLLYVIKNDPKWMARIAYIIERKIEIKKIQKQVDDDI
jgi:transcription initiation factor TFIID subunit 13